MLTAALLMAAVLLSACSGTPTPLPATVAITVGNDDKLGTAVAAALTGTAFPVTSTSAPDDRPTLPPTWTITPTATDLPPTATITPTLTPTITPTVSAESICDSFSMTANLKPGHYFAWNSKISMLLTAVPAGSTIRFTAVQHFSKANRVADLPGGQSNILQVPVKNLHGTGQYDWTLVVKTPNYGDLCEQSGWFVVTGRESTRAEESRTR